MIDISLTSIMIKVMKKRIEKDSLGSIDIPDNAYYGSHTARSLENFPVSGHTSHPEMICAVVLIKKAAAKVNMQLKLLDANKSRAILCACDEILKGKFADQFPVDIFQAGAGTSLHMNINEVIANRAEEIMGGKRGFYRLIHPNDHVNMSQSTNEVIPVAIRLAILSEIPQLLKTLQDTEQIFSKKSSVFGKIIKTGRTHMQDALPITLGQEFSAYAQAVKKDRTRIERSSVKLAEIGIGGTAVGTGINSHPDYQLLMVEKLKLLTGLTLVSSPNLFEHMQNAADFADFSSSLKILALTLIRIGNDLRLLSSGPKTGLQEIHLPSVQPGSSIMPGKVNPSVIEMLTMVCFQIIGMDTAISYATQAGQLELNVMFPLIAHNLLEQLKILTNGIGLFNDKCLRGIEANDQMCRLWFENSTGIAAILSPIIGYEKTAELVKLSLIVGKSIRQLAMEKKFITKKQARDIFDVTKLTSPNLK